MADLKDYVQVPISYARQNEIRSKDGELLAIVTFGESPAAKELRPLIVALFSEPLTGEADSR